MHCFCLFFLYFVGGYHLGGESRPIHTDAQLTGLAELICALGGIKNLPAGSGIIQSTSVTALAYMTGRR